MDWHTPDNSIFEASFNRCAMGSDSALANIVLLGDKYDTEVAIQDGILFRYYKGKSANRRGYGFPLSADVIDLKNCMELLQEDAKRRGVPFEFCLCDERQKERIDKIADVAWNTTIDDDDYIYSRERLSSLSGRKLQKKRNHVNHFRKKYPAWSYEEIGEHNRSTAFLIASKWLEERPEEVEEEKLENDSIAYALENSSRMGMFGGILYVGEEPVAMTLASRISSKCLDVHYEKAIGSYAQDGAFAMINQCFASSESVMQYEFVNREEDMGIEGLRRAKETYDPDIKLKKYYGYVERIREN